MKKDKCMNTVLGYNNVYCIPTMMDTAVSFALEQIGCSYILVLKEESHQNSGSAEFQSLDT